MGILKDVVMPIVIQNKKHSDTIAEIKEKGTQNVETTHDTVLDHVITGVSTGVASGLAKGAGQALFRRDKGKKDDNNNSKGSGGTNAKTSSTYEFTNDDKLHRSESDDVWRLVKPETKQAFTNGTVSVQKYPDNWDTMTTQDKASWLDTYAKLSTASGGTLLRTIVTGPAATGATVPLLTVL